MPAVALSKIHEIFENRRELIKLKPSPVPFDPDSYIPFLDRLIYDKRGNVYKEDRSGHHNFQDDLYKEHIEVRILKYLKQCGVFT